MRAATTAGRAARALALAGLLALGACESDDGEALELPDGTADAAETGGAGDTAGPGDTADDTAGPPDGVADTAPADTAADAPADTGGLPDTGADTAPPPDTGPADTGPADTGPADSGPADADAGDADAGSEPPLGGAALQAWLEAGGYSGWDAESAPHASAGPHFGTVRAFVNDALAGSLAGGGGPHPAGAAAVKELYGGGATVLGWAVAIKAQADSAAGAGWYWYERYQGQDFADALGAGLCTGCHAGGDDFFLSPWPLQ